MLVSEATKQGSNAGTQFEATESRAFTNMRKFRHVPRPPHYVADATWERYLQVRGANTTRIYPLQDVH